MRTETTYIAFDNTEFDNEEECLEMDTPTIIEAEVSECQ